MAGIGTASDQVIARPGRRGEGRLAARFIFRKVRADATGSRLLLPTTTCSSST
jgi:hypothetical protein